MIFLALQTMQHPIFLKDAEHPILLHVLDLVNKELITPISHTPQTKEVETHQSTILIPDGSKLVSQFRACGLVGYDVALTRRRSPVRIRPSPLSNAASDETASDFRFIESSSCLILFSRSIVA